MHFSSVSFAFFLGLATANPMPPSVEALGKRANGQLPGSYLALGDSYSAGIGAGKFLTTSSDQLDNPCGRTDGSYPYRLLHEFNPNAFDPSMPQWTDFYSCSGAKLSAISGQLDTVRSKKFDVITLSIVGNDFFFGDIAKTCIYKFGSQNTDQAQDQCDNELDEIDALLLKQAEDNVIWTAYANAIERMLNENLAENGVILITGYPQFWSSTPGPNDACENLRPFWKPFSLSPELQSKLPLRRDNRNRMNDQVKQVNERIKDDVLGALGEPDNVKFVDIDPLYESHRFCEPVPDPFGGNNNNIWINELNTKPATDEKFNPGPALGDSLDWDLSIPGITPNALRKASTFHPKIFGHNKVAGVLTYQIIKWHVPHTTDKVKWGPGQHCMAFSTGSNLVCFNIPADCFIMVPQVNTAPTAFCSNGASPARVV